MELEKLETSFVLQKFLSGSDDLFDTLAKYDP